MKVAAIAGALGVIVGLLIGYGVFVATLSAAGGKYAPDLLQWIVTRAPIAAGWAGIGAALFAWRAWRANRG